LSGILSGIASGANALGSYLTGGTWFLGQGSGTFWLPEQASTAAGEVDFLFYFIFWISVFFFVLIVGLMLLFVFRFRRRESDQAEESPHHNLPLEVMWTVIPIILVIIIFVMGFKSYLDTATPSQNAYEILVKGQKWNWFFTYPNGHTDSELHVPVDRPVLLTLTSDDVIHSLFIPAFRIKMDAVPGRYNRTWFQATLPGQYPLLCTEYCGTGHSDMLSWCVVHEVGEFEKWLAEAGDFLSTLSPADAGERLYQIKGCKQCHSVDGSNMVGPTFQGLYGATRSFKDGGSLVAEENYIRESILEPLSRVVAGYEPVMPTYQGKINDAEITALIAYIKKISGIDVAEEAGAAGETGESETAEEVE
jgi:cytochrome c oxidase subunit 2